MNHAVEIGALAMVYILSFMKIGSGIHKSIGRYTETGARDDELYRLYSSENIHSFMELSPS
jgi:hypothetical protein